MKKLAFLVTVGLIACAPQTGENGHEHLIADSNNVVQYAEKPAPVLIEIENILQQLDSICLHAAVQSQVHGEYISSYVVTDNFLNVNSQEQMEDRVVVVCMRTGLNPSENEDHDPYLAEYTYLIALQSSGSVWALREVAKIGESELDGPVKRSVRVDPVSLGPDAEALLVTLQSSELSAGDYGTRMETGEIMAWSNGSMTGIFQITFEDFTYSSDEVANSAEDRTVSTYSFLEGDGWLNNLQVISTRNRKMMEENLGIDELDETDTFVYQFNGKAYVPVFK